jgi:serine/threonine-protein kinase
MTPPPRDRQKVLVGRYELHDLLGTGGMADVHVGRDRVLGRTIAVKTLLHQFAADPSFIARFRREAQSAAALNHPQIVGVYDTGSDDGTHFIVMEYIEGKTLRDVIKEEGPLLPERAAEIAADVCSALAYAHQHGIVHRDVKPANIMLTKNGSVKVTDFGIARAMTGDTVTQTAAVLGTAQYFSPEQAQAAPVDPRSDIYSLGVVLYEMLTRQVPFSGASPVAIAYKHVREDPIPPSRLNPDVPPALESIVMKALAKNPDNRYQSAQEMRADLQRAIQGKPVEATPVLYAPIDQTGYVPTASQDTVILSRPPVVVPPETRERRRRTGWALLALIIAAIIGVAIWALIGGPKAPKTFALPGLIGSTQAQAEARLRSLGLDPSPQFKPVTDSTTIGKVVDQKPDPGTQVKKGDTVTIFIGVAPTPVPVPNVVGKTKAEAEAAIKAAGLVPGNETQQPSATVQAGSVISQSPDPDVQVAPGQKVNLVISSGPQTAIVPGVVGETQDRATNDLTARGFKVNPIFVDSGIDCQQPPGSVCKQDPAAQSVRPVGSTVNITIAQEPSPSPTPTDTGTPTSSPPGFAMPLLFGLFVPRRRRTTAPK